MEGFLQQYFYKDEKSLDDIFTRISFASCHNKISFSKRILDYLRRGWFLPSTPILSNLGTDRGLPISCFLNETEDSMQSIIDKGISEVANLMALGGGVATNWSNVREIGADISTGGKTSGVIPFVKNQEVLAMSISQGGTLRRGNIASYLHISHPEIEEFISMRRHNGGDINRKILHGHHGIIIDDVFMQRVITKSKYDLISPATKNVIKTIDAFDLWTQILTARIETGEPYIMFEDNVNNNLCPSYQANQLKVTTSNLCSEILLHTGVDYQGRNRTAVCCLSSLNLEYFDEFKNNRLFFKDVLLFLDNVLSEFTSKARQLGKTQYIKDAIHSAIMERSVGLGVMGFHSHLQQKNIPFDSDEACIWNEHIFSLIRNRLNQANLEIAEKRGANPDCARANIPSRFSNMMAIAPTASISMIANTSPSIDPITSNIMVHKGKSGTQIIKNKNLIPILQKYKKNTDEIWASIADNLGSVQHLDFLTQDEKDVYKTAFEISMHSVITMASTRQEYIDQGQSINLFFLPNISKKHFNEVHLLAWKSKIKTLYYVRSLNLGKMINQEKICSLDGECKSCQ